jgi:hypothetical protein
MTSVTASYRHGTAIIQTEMTSVAESAGRDI